MKRYLAISVALLVTCVMSVAADELVQFSTTIPYSRIVANGRVTYVFTNGTATLTLQSAVTDVKYLIVGGGGGGGWAGSQSGAAGGGGGMVQSGNAADLAVGATITFSVGAGGAGGTSASTAAKRGVTGSSSTLKLGAASQISAGGGGGGGGISDATYANGLGGANGGGGAGSSTGAGKGGVGTLYNGAAAFASGTKGGYIAGGGAGAGGHGEQGNAAENRGGNGGPGIASDILGYECYFGGGGGAGACLVSDTSRSSGNATDSWYPGQGGIGGGGTGGHSKGVGSVLTVPEAGTDGTGGGGGGGAGGTQGEPLASAKVGGKGGSGTVIISFVPVTESAFCELREPVTESRSATLSVELISSSEWDVACGIGEIAAADGDLNYRELGTFDADVISTAFTSLDVKTEYRYAFRFVRGETTNYCSGTFKTLPIHGTGGKMSVLAGGDIIHVFDEPGTWTFNPPAGTVTAQILLVGGGGGGGGNAGGGGGAGGMVTLTREISFGNVMTVTVGAGGDGGVDGVGENGDNSQVTIKSGTGPITAIGGGGGGYPGSRNGASGGCGGGGVGTGGSSGATIQTAVIVNGSRYGNAGGTGNGGSGYEDLGGGGGGAGGTGTSASGSNTYSGGAGGSGLENSITDSHVVYAAGGGGAANYSTHSEKGSGGAGGSSGIGGVGAKGNWVGDVNGGDGMDGRGAGGGGGAVGGNGGRGGSGVVIIRYTPVTDELTVVAHHDDMTACSVDTVCLLTSTGDGTPAVVLYFDYGVDSGTWNPTWSEDKIVNDVFQPGEDNAYSNTVKGLKEGTSYKYAFMVSNANSGVTGEVYGQFKTMLMPPDAPEADLIWLETNSTYLVDCHGTNYVMTYDGFTSASVSYFIAGGGGGGASFDGFEKGGGGSGGETKSGTFTLNYGDKIEYQVGKGGVADNPGGVSWIKKNGELIVSAEGGARGVAGGDGGNGATTATGLPGADGTASDITGTTLYYGAGGGAANGAAGGSGGTGGKGGIAAAGAVDGSVGVRGSGGGGGANDGYDGTVYAAFTNQNANVWHYITACWNSETLLARCLDFGDVLANGVKSLPSAPYPKNGIGIGGYITGDDKSFGGEFRELRLSKEPRDDAWLECEGKAVQTNYARFGATTTVNHHYDLDCAGMAVTTNLLGTVISNGTFTAEITELDPTSEYHTRLLLTDSAGNSSVLPRQYSDPLVAEAPSMLAARRMTSFSGTAAVTESIAVTVTNVTLNAKDEPETFHLEFTPTHRKFWLFAAYGAFDQGTDHKKWAYWEPVAEIAADVDGYDAPAPAGFNEKWRAIRFFAVEWIAPGAMVLDCIETTGAQTLDPDFKPLTEDFKIWLDVTWRQSTSDSGPPRIYGIDTGSQSNPPYTRFYVCFQGNLYCGDKGPLGGWSRGANEDTIYEVWTKDRKLYWKYNNGVTQGGNAYSSWASSGAGGTGKPSMFQAGCKVRMYGCKLWDNEVLKRDFVACLKDGEAQLYDRVSERFFRSGTATPFVAGRTRKGEKYVGDNYGSSASWCDYDSEKVIEVADVAKVDAGTRPAQYQLKVATDKALLVYAAYGANDYGTEYDKWPSNEFVGAVYAGSVTNLIFTAPAGFNQSWRAVKFFAKEWIAPGATVLDGATSTNGQWIDTGFCSKHEAQGAIVDVTLRERFYSGNKIAIYGIQYAPNGDWGGNRFIFGYNANIHCGNQGPNMGDFAAGNRYKFDIYTTASKYCYWKISGATSKSSSFSYANSSCYNKRLTAALYGYNSNYSCCNFTKMTLHSAQIFDDGVMMRDYIPVLKDGEAQLYDKVEKKYYKSETATPLEAENVVSEYYPGDEILVSTGTWKEFEGFGEVAILSVKDAADGKPATFTVRVATDDFAGLRLSMAYGAIPGEEEKDTWAYVETVGDYPQGVTDVEVTAPSGFGTRWNDLKFYTEGFWIPPDAQEVEYIETAHQAYIDTGIYGAQVHGVEMGLQEIAAAGDSSTTVDAGKYYLSSPGFCFYQIKAYNQASIQLYSQGGDRSWNYVSGINTKLNDLAFINGTLTWNGATINAVNKSYAITGPYQPIDKNDTTQIRLFCYYGNTTTIPSARCSYLRMYGSDGNLVANMVPCVWNGVPMMFDTVRRKAYPSSSSIAFTAGPTKSEQRVSAGASTEVWRRYTLQKPDAGTQQGAVIITDVTRDSRTGAPRLIYLKFPQPHDQFALYMCWGWNGTSKTTNGWDNVKFVGYIRPATGTTIVNVPQGYGTTWNNLRFVTYRYIGEEWHDVKYIHSAGNSWIDTKVKGCDVYGFEFGFDPVAYKRDWQSYLATDSEFRLESYNSASGWNNINIHWHNNNYATKNATTVGTLNTVSVTGGVYRVGSTTAKTGLPGAATTNEELSVMLFRFSYDEIATPGRCYYLRLYDQAELLIADLVPRIHYDDQLGLDGWSVGLYDKITGAFLTSGSDTPFTADKSGADFTLLGNSLGHSQLWPVKPLALDYEVTLNSAGTASVEVELASLGANADTTKIELVVGHPTGDPDAEIKEVKTDTATGVAVTNFVRVGDAIAWRIFQVTLPDAPDILDFQQNVPVALHFEENHPAAFSFADCPSGEGVRVYLNGEELPVDVAYWNVGGSGEIYVLIPELSNQVELDVVWYPDPDDAPPKTRTAGELWAESGYFAVYHANNRADATAALVDSTTNHLDAAVVGNSRVVTAAQLAASGITPETWSGTLTMSAWAKPNSNGVDCRILASGRNFVEGFNAAVRNSGMWLMSDGRFMGESQRGIHIGAGGNGGDGVVLLRYTPAGDMSQAPWLEIYNDTSSRKGIWVGFDYRVLWPGQGVESADLDFLWGPTEDNLCFSKPLGEDIIGTGEWFDYDLIPGTNWYYAVVAKSTAGSFTSHVHSVSFAGPAVIGDTLAWEDDVEPNKPTVGVMHLEETEVIDRGVGHAWANLRWGFSPTNMPYHVYLDDFDCASEEPLSVKLDKIKCVAHTQLFYCVQVSNYWPRLDYWMTTNTTTKWIGAWVMSKDGKTLTDGTGWKFSMETTDGGRGVKLNKLTGISDAFTIEDEYYKHLDFSDPIVDHEFNYSNDGGRYYFDTLGQALTDQIRAGGKDPYTKTVTLPRERPLANWADATFRNCSALEYIENWPASMKKVPDETLLNCSSLDYPIEYFICDDTEEIGWNAYAWCPRLYGELEMPLAITNLYSGFRGDSGITGVNATNVWALSGDTFADCTSLQWAHFATNRPLVSVGYFMNDYVLNDFWPRPLPIEVRELPDYFFMNCRAMDGMIEDFLPTNLTSIGESAFEECSLFDGEANLVGYAELTNLSPRAFYDCAGIHQAVMPWKSLKEIGHEAFFGCSSITNVGLNLVEYIGYGAFAGLSSLTNVWFTNMRRNTYLDNSEMEVFSGSDDVAFHYRSKLPIVGYPNQPCFVSEGGTNSMPYRFIIYSERKVLEWMSLDLARAYDEDDLVKATETTREPVKSYRLEGVYLDAAGGDINRHLLIAPERPTRIHER